MNPSDFAANVTVQSGASLRLKLEDSDLTAMSDPEFSRWTEEIAGRVQKWLWSQRRVAMIMHQREIEARDE